MPRHEIGESILLTGCDKHSHFGCDKSHESLVDVEQYLEAFYRGNHDDGEDEKEAEASFYRRLAEGYRKFQPAIKIHTINVGLLYLPFVHYTLESYDGTRLPPLIYDPLRHKVNQVSTQVPEMVKNR